MKALLLILLLSVCPPAFSQGYVIEYADSKDIPVICAVRGGRAEVRPDTFGCYVSKGGQARIIIPHGGKYSCAYWNELRHHYEGDWHPGRRASEQEGCNWRPPGYVN